MIEVLILAVALSMDAFAVSIGLGAKHNNKTIHLELMSAVYFGLFQGIMPLIGYLVGKGVLGWFESYASWIAFILLMLVGSKMIYESFNETLDQAITKITHRVMLILAIATSIDAMAAGFSLNVLDVNPLIACFIIGVITFFFSGLGVFIGSRSGALIGSKAEFLGGITLILIGVNILLG